MPLTATFANNMRDHVDGLLSRLPAATIASMSDAAPDEGRVEFLRNIGGQQLFLVDDEMGHVRTSLAFIGREPSDNRRSYREHNVLALQVGNNATDRPMAVAALSKADTIKLATELLDWASAVVSAGGYSGENATVPDTYQLESLVTSINEFLHALSAEGITLPPTTKLAGPIVRRAKNTEVLP